MNSQELYHHGIKGQRWGVRRFQNEDGSLTSAGKARYNDDGSKKDPKKMSDDDLKRANNRLQMEQQYNTLSGKNYKNVKPLDVLVKAGASAVGGLLAVGGGSLIIDLVKNGKIDKNSINKAAIAGVMSASLGAITSVTSSYGGQINKDKVGK